MIQVTLTSVEFQVAQDQSGMRALVFTDQQSGIVVAVPVSDEACAGIVRSLTGGIIVPPPGAAPPT